MAHENAPPDLSFATTDELLDELAGRCDAIVVSLMLKIRGGQFNWVARGNLVNLTGMNTLTGRELARHVRAVMGGRT